MEKYFDSFRKNIVGIDAVFETPFGIQKLLYADWVASGRLYKTIEKKLSEEIGVFVGNTHTETSETGTLMTRAYHYAHQVIKEHVNASENDVLLTAGFGMTGCINKLQRILGLKICGHLTKKGCLKEMIKPVVFVTHMEHHSNQTSWYETIADVVVLKPNKDMLVDLEELERQLKKYKDRPMKIGSFTACSNVTGIQTPYYEMAKMMHQYNGLCFIDFAASAPYVDIDMHPKDPEMKLDAIMFSPHKFLGGPGSSGVLIFDKKIYDCNVPDNPGGGTVDWTNPWGEYKYIDDIELREDGGTPGFMLAMKTALSIKLKEKIGTENIIKREHQLLEKVFKGIGAITKVHILADNVKERLGIVSFYIEDIHYNLIVKLLNDRYGVQVRGGCACAGTYGHYLLGVSREYSRKITEQINAGDLSNKPGWVRLSLHPTMRDKELELIIDAIKQISIHISEWEKDYIYNKYTNEFVHKKERDKNRMYKAWFEL